MTKHERTPEFSARVLAAVSRLPRSATAIRKDAPPPRGHQPEWTAELAALHKEGRINRTTEHPEDPVSSRNPALYSLAKRTAPEAPPPPADPPAQQPEPRPGRGGAEQRTVLHVAAVAAERNWIEARLAVADAYDGHAAAVAAKNGPAIADAASLLRDANERAAHRLREAKDATWRLWRWQRQAMST